MPQTATTKIISKYARILIDALSRLIKQPFANWTRSGALPTMRVELHKREGEEALPPPPALHA
ncbi:MAG: hypothetical protein WBD67_10095 [Terracidiphilus sp.]